MYIIKFIKNLILIGISSNFLHNINARTCRCIKKFFSIFCEIWHMILPIFEHLKKFVKNLILIGISSNFQCNKKHVHAYYASQKINGKFFPFYLDKFVHY